MKIFLNDLVCFELINFENLWLNSNSLRRQISQNTKIIALISQIFALIARPWEIATASILVYANYVIYVNGY